MIGWKWCSRCLKKTGTFLSRVQCRAKQRLSVSRWTPTWGQVWDKSRNRSGRTSSPLPLIRYLTMSATSKACLMIMRILRRYSWRLPLPQLPVNVRCTFPTSTRTSSSTQKWSIPAKITCWLLTKVPERARAISRITTAKWFCVD